MTGLSKHSPGTTCYVQGNSDSLKGFPTRCLQRETIVYTMRPGESPRPVPSKRTSQLTSTPRGDETSADIGNFRDVIFLIREK